MQYSGVTIPPKKKRRRRKVLLIFEEQKEGGLKVPTERNDKCLGDKC